MNIFHRRHLALFCSVFAAASICGCFLSYGVKKYSLLFSLVPLAVLIILTLVTKYKAVFFKSFLCILFASSAILSQFLFIDTRLKESDKYIESECEVVATVTAVNASYDFLSSYTVEISSINGEDVKALAIAEFEYNAELEAGDEISGSFEVMSIEKYTDAPSYYKAKRIVLYLSGGSAEVLSHNEDLTVRLGKLNKSISRTITENIDGEAGDLVSALLLGTQDLLDGSTVRDFRRAGLTHVLVISGMHLTILMFFIDFVLKRFRIPKEIRGFVVIAVSLFYLALTGFLISALRAFIMSAIVYLAFVFKDDSDMLTTLCFSLFLIIAISPYAVYDIGLWLSFLSVFGIFVAQYFIERLSEHLYKKPEGIKKDKYTIGRKRLVSKHTENKIIIYVASSIFITFFANVFICVPAWLYFNEISLISVVANLVVAPTVTLIMYISPLFLLSSGVAPLCYVFSELLKLLCDFLLWTVSYITSFSNVTASLKYEFTGPIVVVTAILVVICLALKLKRKWLIVIPPLLSCIVFFGGVYINNSYYENFAQIEYVNSGKSEMVLVRDKNEYSIIDISTGGSSHSYNAYLLTVENSATEISSYVLTHYHTYHANSLKKIFRRTIVKTLYLPYPQNLDEYYIMTSAITAAIDENVNVILYDPNVETVISEDVSIKLSERYYLKRSTHPVFYFTLKSYGKKYSYCSSSLLDAEMAEDQIYTELNDSEYIHFGVHGPVEKNEYSYSPSSKNKAIFFNADELSTQLSINSSDEIEVIHGTQYSRIALIKETR